jgi:DNA-binding protein YbaB
MLEKMKGFNKKMKIAKDLIMNANKLIPMIKEKAEDLFKYERTVNVNNKTVSLTLNGKLECTSLIIDKNLLKNEPEKAIQCIKAAITASNQGMLEYMLEECKKAGKDIDPALMEKISDEIEDEIKK